MKVSSLLSLAFLAALSASAQTDATPPSIPVNLAGTTPSATSSVLYWTQAEDNVGVTAYRIYRNGTLLTSTSDNTFADSGLSPATTYTYRVAAVDAAANASAMSTPVVVTTDSADNPRLLRPEHLSYLGAFAFPGGAGNDYAYGGTSIGFNPANNSLFARGHDWYQLVGEISIPTPLITTDANALPVATALQNLTDVTEGQLNNVGPSGSVMSGCKVGGLLVYQNRLLGTSYSYYDAGGSAKRSHFTSSLNLSQTGDFSGMYTVGTGNPGWVAGHMALIPAEWQSALGGPVLTGLDGVPIVTRTSYGPTATVFDPALLGTVDPVPAKLLVGYTYDHLTLGTWGNSTESNPQFNQAAGSSGLVFPTGSDSVLFFGTSGIGIPGYGLGTSDLSLDRTPVPGTGGVLYIYDPASGGKGCHAYPYVAFVWAYRAQDLARVAAGTAQPWDLVPYATWSLPIPFGADGNDQIAGAAYDPATQRIYLCQYNALNARPIIHAYQVAVPAPVATYAAWRSANFTGTALANDAISGPAADPDGAGVTNLQRYAFALAARGPVANPVTLGSVAAGGQTYLTLAFPRRAMGTGLRYIVEASTDLATWAPVPGLTYTAGTPASVTAQDTVPVGAPGVARRFLRLRVSQP
jgi:hypothetical protein